MKNKSIGVFDSGVGGLTVVKEIITQLPNEKVIYYGDTARFPYGPKEQQEVRQFAFQIIEFFRQRQVKLIVIACNTASAAALSSAQEHFDMPIIGVIEPGARAAMQVTRNRRVGVISTEGTARSGDYVRAIHYFDAGVEVYVEASPELVSYAENGLTDGAELEKVVERNLFPLKEAQIDTLILGSTHYPLLENVIQKVMGDQVTVVSSAVETAREVKEILTRRKLLRDNPEPPSHRFISSGDRFKFQELSQRFLGQEIEKVEQIVLYT